MFKMFQGYDHYHIHMVKFHDLKFTVINPYIFFLDFLPGHEKVHDSKKFSHGNSKSFHELRITNR